MFAVVENNQSMQFTMLVARTILGSFFLAGMVFAGVSGKTRLSRRGTTLLNDKMTNDLYLDDEYRKWAVTLSRLFGDICKSDELLIPFSLLCGARLATSGKEDIMGRMTTVHATRTSTPTIAIVQRNGVEILYDSFATPSPFDSN